MEQKKKRKYDTVPEIYMNSSGSGRFFRPHYPVEDSDYDAFAIFEEEMSSNNESIENDFFKNKNMLG